MAVTQVVALTAAQGTGKTELARALADQIVGLHASVSAYLRVELAREGANPSPNLLRERGQALANDPADLVDRVLRHYGWERDTPLIFDAIRHREVLVALRGAVRPLAVLHVGLVVPEPIREARLEARIREPHDARLTMHSTEEQVPNLVQAADLVLDGTQQVGQLASGVLAELDRRWP